MTTTDHISYHDWEAISAYLDGELSPKEQASLQARLEKQPELRKALVELRRTRAVVRAQPKLRAPRNFTLTPQAAGAIRRPREPRGFPLLRLASALASVLFVLVVIGDLFAGAPVAAPAAQTVALVQAPGQPEVQAREAAGGLVESSAPNLEVTQEAVAEATAQLQLDASEEQPKELLAKSALPTPTGEVEAPAAVMAAPAPEGTPLPEEAVAAEAPGEESFAAQESLEYPYPPAEGQLQVFDQGAGSQPAQPETAPQSGGLLNRSILRPLEIGLALVAVAAGIAAVLLRRQNG